MVTEAQGNHFHVFSVQCVPALKDVPIYCKPFAPPLLGGSYAFCRYRLASSRAPCVLSLVCKAWRYSLVARSRWPVVSKILPRPIWLQTSVHRGSPSPFKQSR